MNQTNSITENKEIDYLRNYLQNKFKASFFSGLSLEEDSQYINDILLKYPNNPSALIAKGYLEWRFGSKAAGERLFEKAYNIAKEIKYEFRWFEIGVNSFLNSSYADQTNVSELVLPDIKLIHTATKVQSLILASCDEDYFEKFGRFFINTCLKHSKGAVHIHVINPSNNTMLFFEHRKGNRLSFSMEKTENTHRAYYATNRFLIAPFILNTYDVDILIMDIDQVVVRDIDKVIKQFSKDSIDVFVPTLLKSWMPWNYRLSGNVYLKNNQNVKKFLNNFSSYVNQAVERLNGYDNAWFIDQNAMYRAVEYLLNHLNGEVANIQKYGRTAIGPSGLKKDEFSKLLAIYEKNIDFHGKSKITDKVEFTSILHRLLNHKDLASMFLESFHTGTT